MKAFPSVLCVLLVSLATVHGQGEDPGPSPTESVGCEPHGDHWHCEAPATSAPPSATSSAGEEDPGPSPTESAGCEPHGDHWHCDGPATVSATTSMTASATTAPAPPGNTTRSENPGPSPTESIGCEPHGDHWHCEGPAISETGAAVPGAAVGYAAGALGIAALFV